ncbi:MAG: DNA repair protein RecN [Terrimicrobiaceae bacterium]
MSATLASLRIRNLALVEELHWEPGPGFIAITGETGAGKSVIIGALNLLVGERADRSLIRAGADQCTVEAVFENVSDERIKTALEESGAEPCEEGRLLLKRTLPSSGTGRQFVNGSPCTVGLLRTLGGWLVDLHGPHDHQSLFSRDQQTRLLDGFAGCRSERDAFIEARRKLAALEAEKQSIVEGARAVEREIDLLRHQTAEIEAAALREGEEEELTARHRQAANAARIGQLSAQLEGLVSGDGTSLETIAAECVRTARELARLDPAATAVGNAAESASALASELASALRSYAGDFDPDPAALAAVESRLDVVMTLKRKYGGTVDDIIAFGREAADRLASLESRAARADSLDAAIVKARKERDAAAKALSTRRKPAAKALEKSVSEGLRDLGFARCEFRVVLEEVGADSPWGGELVEFEFAPNPGEPRQPLRAIASSGEISRVMLALKGALTGQDDVPLLVFDEIDANVGGEVATKVGRRMQELSVGRQVLCITHLPQVAAAADHHFVVSKEVDGGRTRTSLAACEGDSREEELARMLGGRTQKSARAHARELLAGTPD